MKNVFCLMVFGMCLTLQPSFADSDSAQCDAVSKDNIGASYEVNAQGKISSLKLWRHGQQVLQQFPEKKMATYFYQSHPGKVQTIRLFDEFETGIEYQQSELGAIGQEHMSWSEHYQLINEQWLQQLRLERVEKQGCDNLMHYSGELNGHQYKVSWLNGEKLVVAYEDKSSQGVIRLKLQQKVTDELAIRQVFADYLNYPLLDFADIGDNENDPFIAKMIRQGFIEHGASGFYHANGEPIAHDH